MPAATPQTATRKTRSQSPPRRVQRSPVSPTAHAIASSSMSPYAWIETGPRLISPPEGDGMDARRPLTERSFVLDQDGDGDLGRTAALEQRDRGVQIDVGPGRERGRRALRVAGAEELLEPPGL